MSKATRSEQHSDLENISVPFKYEIVMIKEDTLIVGEHGGQTIGKQLDDLIESSIATGQHLGKVEYDLTELTDRLALPDHIVKRNREDQQKGKSF